MEKVQTSFVNKDKYEARIKEEKTNKYIIYAMSGLVLITIIFLILIISKNSKLKKMLSLKNDK